MINDANKKLREKYGQDIAVQIKTYLEDDNSIKYYYTSKRYGDSNSYSTIEEAYVAADIYLDCVGDLL